MRDFYQACCDLPHLDVQLADPPNLEELIAMIYNGEIDDNQLYDGAYFDTATKLKEAIREGLESVEFNDRRNTAFAKMSHNIYAFSRAKTFTELVSYRDALLDENGDPVSYGRFRQRVIEEGEEFNDHYLRAEYNSALRFSEMSSKWEYLQRFDVWEYSTVQDDRVRPSHQKLQGKKFAKDDPIWQVIYPPNDWGCRCTVLPAQGQQPDDPEVVYELLEENDFIKPYFRRTGVESGIIFEGTHPYFNLSDINQELTAANHYGMRSVERILRDAGALDVAVPRSVGDNEQWVADELATEWLALDGIRYMFDRLFGESLMKRRLVASARMSGYAHLSKQVIVDPSEVWSRLINGVVHLTYIRYYRGAAFVVEAAEVNGSMQLQKYFKLTSKPKIEALRKGELKYRY